MRWYWSIGATLSVLGLVALFLNSNGNWFIKVVTNCNVLIPTDVNVLDIHPYWIVGLIFTGPVIMFIGETQQKTRRNV